MPLELIRNLAGFNALFIMAADPEYGPELKARFTPLITGVGPVEAGIASATALAALKAAGALPDLVICLGSAGSAVLEQGSVHQVSMVSYRDMDASPLGFEKGRTPFLDLPPVVDLSCMIPGVPAARLSTGANIVSGAAYKAIDADMVDMETFAVLRACHMHDVPLIGLRGISDGAADLKHLSDWTEYLHVVDANLAQAVDLVENALAGGKIDPHRRR